MDSGLGASDLGKTQWFKLPSTFRVCCVLGPCSLELLPKRGYCSLPPSAIRQLLCIPVRTEPGDGNGNPAHSLQAHENTRTSTPTKNNSLYRDRNSTGRSEKQKHLIGDSGRARPSAEAPHRCRPTIRTNNLPSPAQHPRFDARKAKKWAAGCGR